MEVIWSPGWLSDVRPSSAETEAVPLGVTFILHTCTLKCIKAGCTLGLHSMPKDMIYHIV